MNIDISVRELLYIHSCVIVPGFGGFLLNHESAKFNPIEYTFSPPKSTVYFNRSLTKDDGLLTHWLSKETGKSYAEVSKALQTIIEGWEADLKAGKSVVLDCLGEFKEENGHIAFTSNKNTNFDLSSFGLNPVESKYIVREATNQVPVAKKRISYGSYAAALAFAIGVGSLGIFANQQIIGNQWSSILPISSNQTTATVEPAKATKVQPVITPLTISGLPDIVTEIPVEDIPAVAPEMSEDEDNEYIKQHQVIGGSFKSHKDAVIHLKELIRRGYDKSVIVGKIGKFYMVAYDTFDNKEDALSYKRELEQKGKDVFLR